MLIQAVIALLAVSVVSAESDVTFPEIGREITGRVSSRIVSGWEADDGQFPFQMNMRMVSPEGAVSSCGATIIHSQWGLTAAHCTAGRISFVLRGGLVNMTLPSFIFETTQFYNHELYNSSNPGLVQPHDIGLLEFGRTIEFNDFVQPIRLQNSASKNLDYDGIRLTASGWGRTWTNGDSPENLNWVFLVGDTNLRCLFQYGAIIQDSTICASYYNVTSQSTCQGDSGGPLTVIDDDGEITQVGISSFVSSTGCHTDFPAGFIRPGHYHEWFLNVTGVDFDWVGSSTESPETTESTTTTEEEEEEEEEEIECVEEEEMECIEEDDSEVSVVDK